MKINVKIVIMSHLSDAQQLVNIGLINGKGVHNHINFAKALLLNYPNTDVDVEEKELNELWQKITSK
jgi:hypothetical protein